MEVRPGASTVEVTLETQDAGTWLRLVHRDLPQADRANHDAGWDTMLGRLASAVAAA
jgi:Activator of Hsp90 ATPase homolog 1-like protein